MNLITVPDPILKLESEEVQSIGAEDLTLLAEMIGVLKEHNGSGLAAVQLGIPKRIVLVRIDDKLECLINPIITEKSEILLSEEEGCLSIPGEFREIERPSSIKVKYSTIDERVFEKDFDGPVARTIQHELDHLGGVLITDY